MPGPGFAPGVCHHRRYQKLHPRGGAAAQDPAGHLAADEAAGGGGGPVAAQAQSAARPADAGRRGAARYARRILALNDDLLARVKEPDLVGTVRLGTPEDFATMHLSGVLARFSQAYPGVALEVTCDLTLNLIERYRQGSFDLALIMREPSIVNGGTRVWREPLVWVTATNRPLSKEKVLPLVVAPAPCVYRRRAIGVLDKAEIAWRIAYTCSSLAGSLAAVRAGLGTTVLPRGMVPGDLQMIDSETLPDLKEAEFALLVA